jgi:hypothetical protein
MEDTTKKLPVYELIINDEAGTYVNMISLVKNPAIEVNWVAFSKDTPVKQKFKIIDAEKRMLSSAVMIPNQQIYRKNPDTGEEYYVTMSTETIEKAVKKFFKNGFMSNINQNHDDMVSGAYVVESWLTTENDKSKQFGYDLPIGSWFATIFIENQEYWDAYIKTGKLKGGFSVEGMFAMSDKNIVDSIEQSKIFSKEEKEQIELLCKFFIDNEYEISKLLN